MATTSFSIGPTIGEINQWKLDFARDIGVRKYTPRMFWTLIDWICREHRSIWKTHGLLLYRELHRERINDPRNKKRLDVERKKGQREFREFMVNKWLQSEYAWAVEYMFERYGDDRVHCRISQCDYRPQKCGISVDYGTKQHPWSNAFVLLASFNDNDDKEEKLKRACDAMDEGAAKAIPALINM